MEKKHDMRACVCKGTLTHLADLAQTKDHNDAVKAGYQDVEGVYQHKPTCRDPIYVYYQATI